MKASLGGGEALPKLSPRLWATLASTASSQSGAKSLHGAGCAGQSRKLSNARWLSSRWRVSYPGRHMCTLVHLQYCRLF